MDYQVKKAGKFQYIEEGEGEVLLLLHGLFGAMSNYEQLISHYSKKYRVLVPVLPLFELPVRELSVMKLMEFTVDFIDHLELTKVHALGNSLGGHVALLLTLHHSDRVKSLTLTGSSGLYENTMGDTYPRRQDYDFIAEKAKSTFFNREVATKELIDNIFEIVNNPEKGLRIVVTAKSAIRHNLEKDLVNIKQPTLLIWGKNDIVTPPFVGEDFHKGIENSTLHLIDECGHAPMMERPEQFIQHLDAFLAEQ